MTSAERWLPAGLLALLAVLGLLQYRWAGELSEAEKTRMEAGLRSSLRRFDAEVEDELVRVMRFFRAESEDEVVETYAAWLAREGSPNIIHRLYLVRRGETLEVPADGSTPRSAAVSLAIEPRDFPLVRSPLALIVPLGEPRQRMEARGRRGRPGVLVAEIDREFWTGEIIASAASHHLSEYDVVVREEDGAVLWSSEGADVEATMRAPDAESGLLAFGRPPRGFGGPRPKRRPGRDRDWELDRDREAGPLGPAPERRTPMPGRYRLFVRHRSGSLQAAVDEARSRNLAIGFGVLAVLAASIGLLVSSARRARRLSERQMEFVAGVSHELRTPVAVIRAAAQNLADGSVSEPAKVERYGAMVAGEALRLEHLVEEVLELAGIQSSKRQYARECIVARELLETVAARAASELELAQGRIGIHVTDEGLSVTGDRDALERALSNLVRNAIKHGGDGEVELLATRRDEAVVFAVSDRGPGVPDEDRPHVFEAFYRGRRAREGQVKGSGLGLSLVSHIVREHGGEASVRPRAGGGSTFEIRLPESRDAA